MLYICSFFFSIILRKNWLVIFLCCFMWFWNIAYFIYSIIWLNVMFSSVVDLEWKYTQQYLAMHGDVQHWHGYAIISIKEWYVITHQSQEIHKSCWRNVDHIIPKACQTYAKANVVCLMHDQRSLLQQQISETSNEFRVWISSYIHMKLWYLITHPCPNSSLYYIIAEITFYNFIYVYLSMT